jgi:hypothetical protein
MESHIISGLASILTFGKALDSVNKRQWESESTTHLLKHIAERSVVDRGVSSGYKSSISGPDTCWHFSEMWEARK